MARFSQQLILSIKHRTFCFRDKNFTENKFLQKVENVAVGSRSGRKCGSLPQATSRGDDGHAIKGENLAENIKSKLPIR